MLRACMGFKRLNNNHYNGARAQLKIKLFATRFSRAKFDLHIINNNIVCSESCCHHDLRYTGYPCDIYFYITLHEKLACYRRSPPNQ